MCVDIFVKYFTSTVFFLFRKKMVTDLKHCETNTMCVKYPHNFQPSCHLPKYKQFSFFFFSLLSLLLFVCSHLLISMAVLWTSYLCYIIGGGTNVVHHSGALCIAMQAYEIPMCIRIVHKKQGCGSGCHRTCCARMKENKFFH